ncbi:MAG: MotA/TolQ/ExbB proton channel family protein [Verrucomicrobiota bacterium]
MLPTPFLANFLIDIIHRGGPIMYPVVAVAAFAICIVVERIVWWVRFSTRRNSAQVEQVYAALESGHTAEAIEMTRDAKDPVVRMMNHGLNHPHTSLQNALQVAAGMEIQKAGRFLSAMDTVVTLGPLLGLLGTVTGIMGSFQSIGGAELAVEKVTGGIGEALIATAAGLGIAIGVLIPMNYFHARLARLQFDLEVAATNVELLLAGANHESRPS